MVNLIMVNLYTLTMSLERKLATLSIIRDEYFRYRFEERRVDWKIDAVLDMEEIVEVSTPY